MQDCSGCVYNKMHYTSKIDQNNTDEIKNHFHYIHRNKGYTETDPTSDDDKPWEDVNMNRIETFTIVNEAYTSTKKSRTFYPGGSIRTQQIHARDLKIAAVGSSKITRFFDSVEEALRNPDLDNDTKFRLTAIGMYFRNLDNGKKKVEASEIVTVSLGWTKNYKRKHPKMQSLWSHEDIADQVGSYVRSNKFDITPKNLCKHVNETILPNIGVDNEDKKISESTAKRWLKKLGWEFGTHEKGLYADGHERDDVVEYRKKFLKFIEEQYEANQR
nr:11854_t:CDS:2 [Entrophospora candida]